MNKSAAALAADSAVTVSVATENGKTKIEKVFNTTNKLFTLSKYHPVGVMVYHTMEIGGVSWETVIKQYRDKLDIESFDTIDEYCEKFFEFLRNNQILFPEDQQEEVLSSILGQYFSILGKNTKSNSKAKERFQSLIQELEKLEFTIGMDEKFRSIIYKKYEETIDKAALEGFTNSQLRGTKSIYRKLGPVDVCDR